MFSQKLQYLEANYFKENHNSLTVLQSFVLTVRILDNPKFLNRDKEFNMFNKSTVHSSFLRIESVVQS